MARIRMIRPATVAISIVAAGFSAFGQGAAPAPLPAPVTPAQPATQPATHPHEYLKVDGVTGESVDAAHPGWIDIQSFQWGVTAPGTAANTTARAPRTSPPSLNFTKHPDKSSATLQNASAEGKHFSTVVLDVTSHSKGEIYQITMTDVIVSGFKVGIEHDRPFESITLNFAKSDIKYAKLDPQGNRGALQAVPKGLDLRTIAAD